MAPRPLSGFHQRPGWAIFRQNMNNQTSNFEGNFNTEQKTPLSSGKTFQAPQWIPETMNSSEPYIHYVLFPIHTYL